MAAGATLPLEVGPSAMLVSRASGCNREGATLLLADRGLRLHPFWQRRGVRRRGDREWLAGSSVETLVGGHNRAERDTCQPAFSGSSVRRRWA